MPLSHVEWLFDKLPVFLSPMWKILSFSPFFHKKAPT